MSSITLSCRNNQGYCFSEVISFTPRSDFQYSDPYPLKRAQSLGIILQCLFDHTININGKYLVRSHFSPSEDGYGLIGKKEIGSAERDLKKSLQKEIPYLWVSTQKEMQNRLEVNITLNGRVTIIFQDISRREELRISGIMSLVRIITLYGDANKKFWSGKKNVRLELTRWLRTHTSTTQCTMTPLRSPTLDGETIYFKFLQKERTSRVRVDFHHQMALIGEKFLVSRSFNSRYIDAVYAVISTFDNTLIRYATSPTDAVLLRLNIKSNDSALKPLSADTLIIAQAKIQMLISEKIKSAGGILSKEMISVAITTLATKYVVMIKIINEPESFNIIAPIKAASIIKFREEGALDSILTTGSQSVISALEYSRTASHFAVPQSLFCAESSSSCSSSASSSGSTAIREISSHNRLIPLDEAIDIILASSSSTPTSQ